jgi:spore maturation protein CgeB
MKVVILGLSITSSWGNGHATTYRGLVRELDANGHDVLFLERDVPWYADNRDLSEPPFGTTRLYRSLSQLKRQFERRIADADLVIVGSYVPQGVAVADWVTRTANGVTAFYDIDTPVTLAKLARGDYEYLEPSLIPRFDLYLSFTGGPTLQRIERELGSPRARALYCSFDPEQYFPESRRVRWDLGYLGTYSDDRQPALETLLIAPARAWKKGKFVVAGPQYPDSDIRWPRNVKRVEHLPPTEHRAFYNSQRFALNVTRREMVRAGWSPSVRLFEAAACGVPIISDSWPGLDEVFVAGREILIARSTDEILHYLHDLDDDARRAIGVRARERVLRDHTAAHRARELEAYVVEARERELAATS